MSYYDIRRHFTSCYTENRTFVSDIELQYSRITFDLYRHFLLESATHVTKYRDHIIDKGESVSSQSKLSEKLSRTNNEIRKSIETLTNDRLIKTRRIGNETVYKVVNYQEATYCERIVTTSPMADPDKNEDPNFYQSKEWYKR